MTQQAFTNASTPKEFPYDGVVEMDEVKNIIIQPKVYQKYRSLCNIAPKKEWIGIIFYNIILLDETEVYDVFDMLPLSIDTAAHTSSGAMEKIVPFIEAHDIIDSHYGLIHSHNVMNVFFSAEDDSELKVNAQHYAQYLSVIVNAFDHITAKVVVHAESQVKEVVTFLDANRKPRVQKFTRTETLLLSHKCDVTVHKGQELDEEFYTVVGELLEEEIKKVSRIEAHRAKHPLNNTTNLNKKPLRVYAIDSFIKEFFLFGFETEQDYNKFKTYSPIGILYAVIRSTTEPLVLENYGPQSFLEYVKNNTSYSTINQEAFLSLYLNEMFDFLNDLYPSEDKIRKTIDQLVLDYGAAKMDGVTNLVSYANFPKNIDW